MGTKSAAGLLTSVDSMFTTQEERDNAQRSYVTDLPTAEISDFPDHPFKVRMDESMTELADSVKDRGILSPVLVRPMPDGGYQIIAGHRRKMAAELAGLPTVPCIVRELTDDEAVIIMVDSNLQREQVLPSEKAFAYKMKLDPNFTVVQFLLYIARLKGLTKHEAQEQTEQLLHLVGLEDKAGKKMKGLSGGQRQRVGIAQALLGDPDFLVLDEPTAGLDPEERIRFRGIVSGLSRQKIVILSTHIVSDLEAAANQVILLKKGCVLDMKQPHELLEEINGLVWTVTVPAGTEKPLMIAHPCSNVLHMDGQTVLRLLAEEKPHPEAVMTVPNMEDLYLYFFGNRK